MMHDRELHHRPRPPVYGQAANWGIFLGFLVAGWVVIGAALFGCSYLVAYGWTLGVKDAWNEPPYAEIVE